MHTRAHEFYNTEALHIFDSVDDPFQLFTVEEERELIAGIVQTGVVAPGVFSRCEVFEPSRDEDRKVRYEAKRAQEILGILTIFEDEGIADIDTACAKLHAKKMVDQASLVEAARKYLIGLRNNTITESDRALYSHIIRESQAELYSEPDQYIIRHSLGVVIEAARRADQAQATELVAHYPFLDVDSSEQRSIDKAKKAEMHRLIHKKYDPIFERAYVSLAETELSNSTLHLFTQAFMEQSGFPMGGPNGWRVLPPDHPDCLGVAGFKVDPAKKLVYCGRRSTEITQKNFEGLMIHEIGIHATKAENGEQAGDGFKVGLPGSNDVEEGTAILMQKIWNNEELDEVGRDHYRYLTVCYARGDIDGRRHTEQEVLDFATDLMAAQKRGLLHDPSHREKMRRIGAVEHTKRCFRGMPPGETMVSNLSYLSGKLKMIDYFNSDDDMGRLLEYLQSGKINPLDQLQVELFDRARQKRHNPTNKV